MSDKQHCRNVIISLMMDGRERTFNDILVKTGLKKKDAKKAVYFLSFTGVLTSKNKKTLAIYKISELSEMIRDTLNHDKQTQEQQNLFLDTFLDACG